MFGIVQKARMKQKFQKANKKRKKEKRKGLKTIRENKENKKGVMKTDSVTMTRFRIDAHEMKVITKLNEKLN